MAGPRETWTPEGALEGSVAEDDGPLNINRVELAAALIQYDDEPGEHPSARALQSAILSPFRHLLSPPIASANPAAPQESYFDTGVLPPGSYSASGASVSDVGRTSFSAGRDEGPQRRYPRSLGGSQFGVEADKQEQEGEEEEERLAEEWGLGDYLSQLGSQGGSVSGRTRKDSGMSTRNLPRVSIDTSDGRELEQLETRSLSGIEGKRATTFSITSPSDDSPRPPTSKLRILERPQGRPRSQSLGTGTSLELGAFDPLPTFATLEAPTLSRPSLSSDCRLSVASYSGLQLSDEGRSTSPYLSSRPSSRLSLAPSPRPLSHLSLAPSADLEQPPRPPSTTPSVFTSRFDPSIMALARQEIEKDRPNFANKDAGAPPKVVRMPAPLNGRPPSPHRRVRTEGPDPEPEEEVVEEEQLEAPKRPAGALYGRSLLDVMAERKAATKSRQKQYVPGQDGRMSMMDWGKAPFLGDAAGKEDAGAETSAVPRSRSTIFGPDLVYQRDMQRRVALERAEAEEKEEEDRAERKVWERERIKAETKRTNKMRRAAGMKLEGVGSPERRERREVTETTPRASKHSVAPSLSMPVALDDQGQPSSWFPPPSPKAPSISSSTSSRHAPIRHIPQPPSPYQSLPFPRRPVLVARASDQQAFALRTAVMMGTMTPQEAIAEASRLGLGSNASDDDERPLGERLTESLSKSPLPPRLQLAFLDTEDLAISPERKVEIAALGGRADSSDDDDVPLGLRHPRADDDDDVPLGLPHSNLRTPESDDDVPLAFSSTPHQQQQAYLQAQFQAQQAQHAQQAMFVQYAQQQQQFAHDQLAGGQGLAHYGQPGALANPDFKSSFGEASFGGSEGGRGSYAGSGGMVERWRRGVS